MCSDRWRYGRRVSRSGSPAESHACCSPLCCCTPTTWSAPTTWSRCSGRSARPARPWPICAPTPARSGPTWPGPARKPAAGCAAKAPATRSTCPAARSTCSPSRSWLGQARYADALALWRGAPLADLPGSPLWDRWLEPLHGLRLRAAEELIGQRLGSGDHAGAVSELRGLLGEHPYREDLWSRLLLALHGGGRRAEALRTYASVRARLVDELGVEPGTELRRAYEAILADERAPAAPHQLPPDVPDFIGREAELAALAGPFPLATISGPPGVGKSALAVRAALALRTRFPAGQLYLDLDGREPGDLLAEALRALGVESPPPTVRERSALLRSLLAERPMLLLLGDALDAAQVRPLLPGNDSSVIVTSRRRITELPGALHVDLAELPQEEALLLLGRIAGADRVARERADALAIADACARLPLALRSAGSRLAGRPGWSLAVLRQRLQDDRLGELKEVRACLERSYRHLLSRGRPHAGHPRPARRARPARLGGRRRAGPAPRRRRDGPARRREPAGGGRHRPRRPAPLPVTRPDPLEHALERGPDPQGVARVLAAWTTTTEHAMARLPTTVFSLTAAGAPRWRLPEQTLDRLTADPLTWFETEHEALA
ncbi:BTAD domain-containing putative transcriptional regulator [Nonomuraea ferruginea]